MVHIKDGLVHIDQLLRAFRDFYQYFLKRVGSNYKILETLSTDDNVPQLLQAHQQLQRIANLLPDQLQKLADCFQASFKQFEEKQLITNQTKASVAQILAQFLVSSSQITSYFELIVQIENTPADHKQRNILIVEKCTLIHSCMECVASYLYSFFSRSIALLPLFFIPSPSIDQWTVLAWNTMRPITSPSSLALLSPSVICNLLLLVGFYPR